MFMEPNARGQTSKNGMALLRYVKWCMFHLLQYSAYLSLSQLDYLLLCCVAYLSLSQLVYLLLYLWPIPVLVPDCLSPPVWPIPALVPACLSPPV